MLLRTLWRINFAAVFSLQFLFCTLSAYNDLSEDVPVSWTSLRRYLSLRAETTTCILFKQNGTDSTVLEEVVTSLISKSKLKNAISSVVTVPYEVNVTDIYVPKDGKFPLLRCYLGTSYFSDFCGRPESQLVRKWLKNEKSKNNKMFEYEWSLMNSLLEQHTITLIGLPSLMKISDQQQLLDKLQSKLENAFSVFTVIVHPKSKHRSSFTSMHASSSSINVYIKKGYGKPLESKVFKGIDVEYHKLMCYILSQAIGERHLTSREFTKEVLTVSEREFYRPSVILFYAWWANNADIYLTLFKRAVSDIKALGVKVKFAVVDIAAEQTLVASYMKEPSITTIPFIVVFLKEKGKESVNQTYLALERPTALNLYEAMEAKGIHLLDSHNQKWTFVPYRKIDLNQYSDLREGPWGTICTAWSSNMTETDLPKKIVKKEKPQKMKLKMKPLEDRLATTEEGVPMLNEPLWDAIVETSKPRVKSFVSQKEKIIRVVMLVFVREGCSSCQQKMQVFQQVNRELKKTETSRLFLVNCSTEVSLCAKLKPQGYPSVIAFRNFAALSTPKCHLPVTEKPYTRRDYHGPISTWELLAWNNDLSDDSIINMAFENQESPLKMKHNVRLVATAITKESVYLPVAPGKDRGYFFSTQCLRLACEQLFGLAACHLLYSKEIPSSEFADTGQKEMVITQVVFEREDGISTKIMAFRQSLKSLLEDETSSRLHLFHKPHKYNLQANQKCEEDHHACTQVLVSFTKDHLRLPVTFLTSELFHTRNNPLFEVGHPVLIALGHPENVSEENPFMELLREVAVQFYKDLVVTVLDVSEYPAWAGRFVPVDYYKLVTESNDAGPLHTYPRLCLVDWKVHTKAAFYPPLETIFSNYTKDLKNLNPVSFSSDFMDRTHSFEWDKNSVADYISKFLKKPDAMFVPTENF